MGNRKSMSRETREILEEVQELLKFKEAGFGSTWQTNLDAPLPKSEEDVDYFIKERTRYYREQLIMPEIAKAIQILKDRGRG